MGAASDQTLFLMSCFLRLNVIRWFGITLTAFCGLPVYIFNAEKKSPFRFCFCCESQRKLIHLLTSTQQYHNFIPKIMTKVNRCRRKNETSHQCKLNSQFLYCVFFTSWQCGCICKMNSLLTKYTFYDIITYHRRKEVNAVVTVYISVYRFRLS